MVSFDFNSFNPEISDLPLEHSNITRVLGYSEDNVPEHISRVISKYITEAQNYTQIKTGYRIFKVDFFDKRNHQIGIGQKVFYTNRTITRELKNSTHTAIYVTTLGSNFDKWSSELFESADPLAGYVIDTIGSELVELSAHWLEAKIESLIKVDGLKCTHAHSPGYCDWLVDEQHKLFSLLPKNVCGISLTPTALMVPIKSLSGVIGIGTQVKKGSHPCSICSMKNCNRRMYAYKLYDPTDKI